MENPRIALIGIALVTAQVIAFVLVVASGGFSPLGDTQTRAVIQTSYAGARGDPLRR